MHQRVIQKLGQVVPLADGIKLSQLVQPSRIAPEPPRVLISQNDLIIFLGAILLQEFQHVCLHQCTAKGRLA